MTTLNDDFSNDASTTGQLFVDGGLVKGRIESIGDHDWLRVALGAGQTYSFYVDVSGITPNDLNYYGTPLLVLYDTDGKQLASNVWAHSEFVRTGYFNFTSPTAGVYYLDIGAGNAGGTGTYAVKAVLGATDDYPNTTATTGVVPVDGQATGALQTGLDMDWFKTSLTKGHSYVIQLLDADAGGGTLGPEAHAHLQLLSPTLEDLGTVSNSGKYSWPLYVNAGVTGDYIINVEGGDRLHDVSGSYTVKVTEVPVDDYKDAFDDETVKLKIGSTLYGRTGHSGDIDSFRVEVQAGQTYLFSLKHEAKGVLNIWDGVFSDVVIPRAVDDTAQYIYKATKSGTVFLQAYEYLDSLGQYSVSAQTVVQETTPPKLVSAVTLTEGGFWTPGSDIVLTFSEAILAEAGSLFLYDEKYFNYHGPTGADVAVNGKTLTWHMPKTLADGTEFVLQLDADMVRDLSGNALAEPGSFVLKTRDAGLKLSGWSQADRFSAIGSGHDSFDGKEGVDTVFYDRKRVDFTVTHTSDGYTVKDKSGLLGTDTMINMERIIFSDGAVALDVDGVGGQAYRLYRAAFDRTPDKGGLGFWISHMDTDVTLNQAAQFFLDSPEFVAKYGATTNQQFVTKLYANVLHRAPDADGLKFWLHSLATDTTRAGALAYFSESPENHAGVASIIANGFDYQPMI